MREYIVNLTNNLIGKHGFDLMFNSMKAENLAEGWQEIFAKLVRSTISPRDVRKMSPETLGKVMCSFEEDELPSCYNPGLFFGKPDQYLKNIVSYFLAWSIRCRLEVTDGAEHGKIPAYVSKNTPQRKPFAWYYAATAGLSSSQKAQKVHTTKDAVRLALSTGLVDDTEGVMPEVLTYLKQHPGQILEYGMQIQDAYNVDDHRTPIVKMALTLQSALR